QSRTFGSASRVISSWIFSGVVSLFSEAADLLALGTAVKAGDTGAVARSVTAHNAAAARRRAPVVAVSVDITVASRPKHTPTSVELRPSPGFVQKLQADATLTLVASILIFAVRSEKCCANVNGLSSDRLSAQDRFPDARRLTKARADDSGAL